MPLPHRKRLRNLYKREGFSTRVEKSASRVVPSRNKLSENLPSVSMERVDVYPPVECPTNRGSKSLSGERMAESVVARDFEGNLKNDENSFDVSEEFARRVVNSS